MVKFDVTPLIILGALGIGGYILIKKLGGLIPKLPRITIPFITPTLPTPQEAPRETIVHFVEKFADPQMKEKPIWEFDPFGISKIFAAKVFQEAEERGIDRPLPTTIYDPIHEIEAVMKGFGLKDPQTQPYEELKIVSEAPPLDPFGISEVFKQRTQQEITRRVKRTEAVHKQIEQQIQGEVTKQQIIQEQFKGSPIGQKIIGGFQ